MPALEIEDLRKSYGGRTVVDGLSLTVEHGEIVGVLGRNGAGKTTTVECAVGLRRPDAGQVRVLGVDPQVERDRVRQAVGVQLQKAELHHSLTVLELVRMYRSFYADGEDPAELVERLGLGAVRGTRFERLSGGEAQRLSIALALVGRPRLAVLDELTTGLDAAARRGIWEHLADLRERGVTVVLVTHVMEEAERLCDRVAVVDAGRVAAIDTPAGLVARVGGGQRLVFRVHTGLDTGLLHALPGVDDVVVHGAEVMVSGDADVVPVVTAALARHGVPATDFRTERPTLDDAFLALTGHAPGTGEVATTSTEETR